MARSAEVAPAPSNVVRLPTAAGRKVDNLRYAAQRQAMLEARVAEPWPGKYKFPSERAREKEDGGCDGMGRSVELALALAMFSALPPDAKDKAASTLAVLATANPDCEISRQAASIGRRLSRSVKAADGCGQTGDGGP